MGEADRGSALWADSAYSGRPIWQHLESLQITKFICQKGAAGYPLSRYAKKANREKSRIRARVEHVFGRIAQFGGDRYRRVGLRRAQFEATLSNLTYNLDRYAMFHG